MSEPTNTAPQGWYPDPQVPGIMRYWDGAAWTAQRQQTAADVANAGAAPIPVGSGFSALATAIKLGLSLSALVLGAAFALYLWGLSMIDGAVEAAVSNGDFDRLDRFDDLNLIIVISEIVVFVLTGIVWSIWQQQLARTARPGELDRSPGQHAGFWFIPLANFALGPLNVKNLWEKFVSPRSTLVIWWWATLVGSLVLVRFAPGQNVDSVADFKATIVIYMVTSSLRVVSAILAIQIIRTLTTAGLARSAGTGGIATR